LGARNCGRPEDTAAVDSVFHLMGNRRRGMGCGAKYLGEAVIR